MTEDFHEIQMLYLASPRKNGFQKGKTHNNVFISLQPVLS